uniref:Uncharacterized protein n=1 Tax=Steinernema glaseri TaxID=37863 RepID=A0A1I7Y0R1_9BILA
MRLFERLEIHNGLATSAACSSASFSPNHSPEAAWRGDDSRGMPLPTRYRDPLRTRNRTGPSKAIILGPFWLKSYKLTIQVHTARMDHPFVP